jgi:hypothetical protein
MATARSGDFDPRRDNLVPAILALSAFVFLIVIATVAMWKWNSVTDAAVIIGASVGLVGTIVGVFLGIEVARLRVEDVERARRDAEEARARAELRALRLAGSLDPARAESLLTANAF